ncbi:fumarylacetoacetate hydrolase family protein [Actinomycetospora endophytica]|uniref:Fumarylacetoacetate hydrolase family protein n=1 Tax=Actinomycetospora endophytica TaxID=2291215 RepID=A0ABS8P1F5_9PSEU|nr:fumarylacetoacetate hydrolase family protein [Actinomycetospora endophytica]MCD2191893.1 fumarylacetoacetate hydrolase family protein [Actinomycetospora endophytica]
MNRLGTFSRPGDDRRFPGAVTAADRVVDLTDQAPTTRDLLADWDRVLPRLDALGDADGEPLAGLRVHAPLEPGQVLQSGANYRTHVIDLAVAHRPADDARTEAQARAEIAAMMDRRAAEGTPYLFVGLPSAVTGPYDDVTIPPWTDKLDWELELAAVIGREAFRVDREHALSHVAAYTIANDLTARDQVFRRDMPEIGTDWFRGKNGPGFTPLGPWLLPARDVDPADLRIHLELDGEVMQDETTKDMLFDTASLVAAASEITPLRPGDLVLTGSPAGNGMARGRLLRPGDVMTGTISGPGDEAQRSSTVGFGAQRTRVVA